jgi:transglutaminase-like putative cysteine protease
MHWVHGELNHQGDQVTIEPLDAMNILETCRQTRCALFCIHKAIVLTEALLSIGIQARRVACLPYGFDGDCHVVTLVLLPELMKWIVLDPTFNTFFHDAHGSPLSPLEIRELYREHRTPVFKHIEMNKVGALMMNGVECSTYDEWYAAYMAKNCFRFHCPLASGHGQAGREEAYVFLNPVGYAERNAYDTIQATTYRTDNAEYFFRDAIIGGKRGC